MTEALFVVVMLVAYVIYLIVNEQQITQGDKHSAEQTTESG